MEQYLLTKLDDCSNELEKIKKRINKNQFDDMVRFLQCYAIIKACGTIEYVVKNLIADRVEVGSNEELKKYISVKVRDSSSNPKTGNISKLLEEFSPDLWKKRFDEAIASHGEEKTSLNSLVQLRNDFAHGSSSNTGIITIIKYFNHARTIVSFIDDALNDT